MTSKSKHKAAPGPANETDAERYLRAGREFFDRKDYGQALKAFNKAIALDPGPRRMPQRTRQGLLLSGRVGRGV